MRKAFKVGRNAKIDATVILGYLPEKTNAKSLLIIKDNARIRSGTVIYAGTKIGDNLQTGHNVVIREENTIGDNFSIWSNSVIDYASKIGNNVKIHSNCYLAQFTVIEDGVFLAPGVMVANDLYPGCGFSKKYMKGPLIKRGAQIGINATILPYVVIGARSLIGAGSVVTHDVPDDTVVLGNPARAYKNIYELECCKGIAGKPYKKEKHQR